MLDWVAGAVESTKAAFGITKAMIAHRDEGLVQERVFELNGLLAGLQQQMLQGQLEQMQLIEDLRSTRQQLSELSDSAQKNARYERHKLDYGPYVYRLRPEFQGEESEHFICSVCFEANQKRVTLHELGSFYSCPACKQNIQFKPMPKFQLTR